MTRAVANTNNQQSMSLQNKLTIKTVENPPKPGPTGGNDHGSSKQKQPAFNASLEQFSDATPAPSVKTLPKPGPTGSNDHGSSKQKQPSFNTSLEQFSDATLAPSVKTPQKRGGNYQGSSKHNQPAFNASLEQIEDGDFGSDATSAPSVETPPKHGGNDQGSSKHNQPAFNDSLEQMEDGDFGSDATSTPSVETPPKPGPTGSNNHSSSKQRQPAFNASSEHSKVEEYCRDASPVPSVESPPKPANFQLQDSSHLNLILGALARDEDFMDVTLTAEGRSLKAHKSVLSAVSSYFQGVLRENPCQHPIIIMPRDVKYEELFNIVNYIYNGEVTVAVDNLASMLKTAEILQVTSLAELLKTAENIQESFPVPSDSTENPHAKNTAVGNMCTSNDNECDKEEEEASSSLSSFNKKTNQEISRSQARPKSPDPVVNDSDFMDITIVKEEIESEDDDNTTTSATSAQLNENSLPKTNKAHKVYSLAHSSGHNNQTQGQGTSSSASTSQKGHVLKEKEKAPLDVKLSENVNKPNVCPYRQSQHKGMLNVADHQSSNNVKLPGFTCECGDFMTQIESYKAHLLFCIELRKHVKLSEKDVKNPKPFVCPYCQNQFRERFNMVEHLRIDHPTKSGVTCKCGYIFFKIMSYEAHLKICRAICNDLS